MTRAAALHPVLDRVRRPALYVGLAGLALGLLGLLLARRQFFRSYLVAYLFWLGIALGSCGILMIQHLSGGRWGLVVRRPLESAARMVPLMAVLFLPLLLGLDELYVWAQADAVRADPSLQYKRPYLNIPFFLIRTGFYFALWLVGAWLLNRWSAAQDRGDDAHADRRLRMLSGPGLVLYVLSMTAAAVDWVMSIDPNWYSTMFGLIFVIGQVVSSMAMMILVLALLHRTPPLAGTIGRDDFHDLGNLLMAFVILWAYVQFSQFLIVWMGNLAEETPFYVARLRGGMRLVALALVVFHFFVPFLLLLSRRTKRSVEALATVAGVVLLMRLVDLFWIVMPTFVQARLPAAALVRPHWLDLAIPIGMGGIWLFLFIGQLARRPLLPPHDPRLAEVPAHG